MTRAYPRFAQTPTASVTLDKMPWFPSSRPVASLFVSPVALAAPMIAELLGSWAARGLSVSVLSWDESRPEGLAQRLGAEEFERVILWGLSKRQAVELSRALGNVWTPRVVITNDSCELPDPRFVPASPEDDLSDAGRVAFAMKVRGQLQEPVLSVVVPAWNAASWLPRCLASIALGARDVPIEVIVVDDGSTDTTPAVLDRLSGRIPGLRVVRQENRGHGGAINTGLRLATGRYFRVIDADDRVDPSAFREFLSRLSTESADLVLTDYLEDREGVRDLVPIQILDRLASGALVPFEALIDPFSGVTSWAVLLSTSTFRTALLKASGLRLTERSPYVDLEYAVFGLDRVETLRRYRLPVYLYTLGRPEQSVSSTSYQRNHAAHEAVLLRLCQFAAGRTAWSPARREYVVERVLNPIAARHLEILRQLRDAEQRITSFRERIGAFEFIRLPRRSKAAEAKARIKALAPARLWEVARQSRTAVQGLVASRDLPAGPSGEWLVRPPYL